MQQRLNEQLMQKTLGQGRIECADMKPKASGYRPDAIEGRHQDQDYFNRRIAPAIDGKRVAYLGPVGGSSRARTLGEARALLHLINVDEPFGLSVVEAMACGTPVIAFKRGSMPELIEHRVTGFLVDTLDEAVEAIGRIGEIDRASCRAAVKARFTVDRMADRYVSLYRSLLEKA